MALDTDFNLLRKCVTGDWLGRSVVGRMICRAVARVIGAVMDHRVAYAGHGSLRRDDRIERALWSAVMDQRRVGNDLFRRGQVGIDNAVLTAELIVGESIGVRIGAPLSIDQVTKFILPSTRQV